MNPLPSDPGAHGATQPSENLLCFLLHGQELAIPITAVKETIPTPPLTRLPLCPDFIAGLINLRGDVVAVLDLGCFLDLGPARQDQGQVILLRGAVRGSTGCGALCGLLVDRLTAARRLSPAEVRPLPGPGALGRDRDVHACLRGVASVPGPDPGGPRRPLLLLDLPRLLGTERLQAFRRPAAGARDGGPSPTLAGGA